MSRMRMHVDDGDVQGSWEWQQRAGMLLRLAWWVTCKEIKVNNELSLQACCLLDADARQSGAAECGMRKRAGTMDSPIGPSIAERHMYYYY